ncbi:ABCC4 [Symbiodinium sp. CCMP2592]|nr:ABCC4 [Symbiodinium sp. CCMP2592]
MASHPLDTASCPSRFWLLWLWPLLRKGSQKPLKEEDMYEIPECLRTAALDPCWFKRLNKMKVEGRADHISVLWLLMRTFGWRYVFILVTFSVWLASLSLLPFLTESLFEWLAEGSSIVAGLGWCAILVGSYLVNCNAACQWYQQTTFLGCELRASAAMLVFRRALQLQVQDSDKDVALNLMQVDAERLYIFAQLNHLLYVALVVLLTTSAYLIALEGPAVAAMAMSVVIATLLLQSLVSRRASPARRRMQQCSDERISLLAEVLDAVRVLKMYGWAQYLQGRIEEIRRRELRAASLYLGLRAFSSALLYCSPLLSMLAVLTMMHLQDKELSAERVFLIFTTVGLVRAPLGGVAMGFTAVVDGLAAFRRLNAFVSQQSFDLYQKDLQQEPEAAKETEHDEHETSLRGSFVHGSESSKAFQLSADLSLQPGELVAVCGRVASGKSSLLLGLLGELRRVGGSQSLRAGVAYLAQSPWIRSGTVRDVVVQELPFDEKQYSHAIRAAQLGPDLREWPGGDRHAVGARGTTLSGGQRTRLGLAHVLYRCLVSEVRVVLLDDCLAAVDPHVARAICEEALLGVLLQDQRSVVMVMNSNFVALRAASRIVNMEQGRASVYDSVDSWIADCSQATREACLQTLADIQARPPSDFSDCVAEEGDVLECSEQSRTGMLSTKTLTYYFGSGRHSAGVIFLCFIVASMLSVEGLRIYSDHFMGVWAARDSANTAEESGSDFQTFCLWVLLAVLGAFLRGWLVVYVALKSSENIHRRLLARLMSAPIGLFDTTPRGRILGHFSKDLDAVDALLPQYLLDFLQDITMLLGIVVVCVWSTPLAAVAVVPVLFGFYKIRHFFSRTAREAKRLDGVTRAPLYSAMGDVADGLATLRAHGQQKSLVQQFQALLDRNGKVFFQTYILQPWCILVLDSLGSCIVCIASVFCVLLRDSLPASTSTMAISYALMTRGKLQFCIRLSIEAENQLVAAERLAQFEAVIPTEPAEGRPPPEDWPREGKIFFEHVSMRYRADLPQVLKGFHLQVPAGRKVSLVGRTGSGKSSLLGALLRVVNLDAGRICIDGVDIANVPLQALRTAVSLIPQEPVLWSGTVAENLDPTKELSEDRLREALSKVHFDAKLDGLGGLAARVERSGGNFSLGQRQLLCIARCIARSSRVVLVDEATSCVDGETDAQIQDALRTQFHNCTMLVVAHRLQTIMDADLIVVLDAGCAVETGHPAALCADPTSRFAQMAARAPVEVGGEQSHKATMLSL